MADIQREFSIVNGGLTEPIHFKREQMGLIFRAQLKELYVNFVLVHGSGMMVLLGKQSLTIAKGHLAFTPTIAGHGKGVDKKTCSMYAIDR